MNITKQLSEAMTQNPHLRILINCGRHDLQAPWFGMKYSINHLNIEPKTRENIKFSFYTGGHMMYTLEESNVEWNNDIRKFITE